MNRIQKIISITLLSLTSLNASTLKVPHSIVLTFDEYPTLENIKKIKDSHTVVTVVETKHKALAYQHYHGHRTKPHYEYHHINLGGIPLMYYGYITYTRNNGIIMLPRMHESSEFYILLSTHINPIFMIGNTIHHLEVIPNTKNAYYKITKNYDAQTQTNFWNVEQIPLPTHGQLPLETIIIFVEPEDLYIPEGISITNDNPQAILPVIYLKNDKNNNKNSIASLEINYLFKAIDPIKKS